MTARDVLHRWTEESISRIEKASEAIAGDKPEIREAAERVRDPRGPDGFRAPDAAHAQVFRLLALADLVEKVADTQGDSALEDKPVGELREIAEAEGIERPAQLKKGELVKAIREKRQG